DAAADRLRIGLQRGLSVHAYVSRQDVDLDDGQPAPLAALHHLEGYRAGPGHDAAVPERLNVEAPGGARISLPRPDHCFSFISLTMMKASRRGFQSSRLLRP